MFYNVVFPGNSFVGILVIDPARAYTVVVKNVRRLARQGGRV